VELAIQPVESRTNVIHFANPAVVLALTQTRAPKIEAQGREAEAVQRFHGMEGNFVVHGSAVARMRVADKSGVAWMMGASVEQRFEPSCRSIEKKRTNCAGLNVHFESISGAA
jgi:hypothetical protein